MKKILLASTALVGFASAAAAEVALSGYAEIGVFGGNNDLEQDVQFHSDMDVTFSLSGETDNGIAFGASIDLDEVGDDCGGLKPEQSFGVDLDGDGNLTDGATVCQRGDPISQNGRGSGTEEHTVWVSGSFGKVTLGDTDGALDWAASEVYMGTSINDDHSTHAGAYWFTGLDGLYDGQVMRYEYAFGDFAIAGSLELDDERDRAQETVDILDPNDPTHTQYITLVRDPGHVNGDPVYGVGVKWSGDFNGTAINAGLGYQKSDTGYGDYEAWAVSGGADLAMGLSFKVGYSNLDGPASYQSGGDWWGVGVGYTKDAWLVQANYGEYDLDNVDSDPSGFGIVANYDLGGGAVAMVGYGHSEDGSAYNGQGDDTWSAGLGLSF